MNSGYKIKKYIREMVVFAVQSVIKDPPFTDWTCSAAANLLIYLEAEQQNRLIPIFPLRAQARRRAVSVDLGRYHQPYRAIQTARSQMEVLSCQIRLRTKADIIVPRNTAMTLPVASRSHLKRVRQIRDDHVAALSNRVLLQAYAPASVTTDIQGNILYVHGDTGRFLRQPVRCSDDQRG